MEPNTAHTSRSIFRSVAYGAATWVVPLFLGIISTPVIVRNLGIETYGIYALVLGFVGYTFSFGIGRAMTKYIAEFRASGETERIREIVSVTLLISALVGVIGAVSIAFSAEWLVRDVLKINEQSREVTVTGLYIASALIFVSIFNQAFGSALQGIHRFDVYSKIFNASSIAQIGGTLILALFGFGLVQLLVWNLFTVTVSSVVTAVLVRRYLKEFGFDLNFSRKAFTMVAGYSVGIVGYQIVGNAMVIFERSWLTRELGPESLAYYVVAFTPGLYLQGFVGSLVLILVPLVSEYENRRDELLQIYQKATRLITTIVFLFVMLLVVDSRNILMVWMGPVFAEQAAGILIMLSISFGVVAILSVSWQMKEGLGVPRFNFAASSIALVVGVPAMIIFTERAGPVGMAAGRLTAFAVMAFSLVHFERWLFDRVQIGFWLRLIARCGLAAVAAGSCQFATHALLPMGWPALLVSTTTGTLIFVLAAWLTGLVSIEEKGQIRRVLARVY
jgi:O-antigen/teichoic acid export membrane protein